MTDTLITVIRLIQNQIQSDQKTLIVNCNEIYKNCICADQSILDWVAPGLTEASSHLKWQQQKASFIQL